MREITFQTALEEAVAEEMRRDPRVFTMATDFTGNPIAEFGPTRVRFSPISESVLTGCIREVRRALGDDPSHPRYVETVHGRGYRFVGDLICASGRFTIPTRWLTDASATAARDNELAALAREFAEAVVQVISRSMPKPPKR